MTTVIEGFEGLQGVIDDVEDEFNNIDYKPALERYSQQLENEHQTFFDMETGPSGVPWEEWHWRKEDSSDSHKTLDDEGTMKASMKKGGLGNILEIDDSSLTYGTEIVYAGIHNFGAVIETKVPLVGRGGKGYLPADSIIAIPQREFVGVTDESADSFNEQIADHAIEELK